MKNSMTGRAIVAIALMVGFYLLAVAMAALLLYIPYAEYTYAGRLHIKIALMCVIGAGVILFSILPRIDRFAPPGPQLTREQHPVLFSEVDEIARLTGQAAPSEIYVVSDVNAWVTQRGGIMGFFSRRVMGLGLPLMEALTVSQFRAVLAHEFGHFHGGDTKLGPWIYKTRSAIFRTVQNVAESSGFLYKPFELYAKLFLRITEAISRQQELAADALAARVVSPRALAEGLTQVHRGALAFDSYWSNEVAPVLNAGYRPSLAAGYAYFVNVDSVSHSLDQLVEEELKRATPDPYDSHPPLAARLAALNTIPLLQRAPASDELKASSLLGSRDELERELLGMITGMSDPGRTLPPIRWTEVGEQVWMPQWKRQVSAFATSLEPLTASSAVSVAGNLDSFLSGADPQSMSQDEKSALAASTIGCAMAVSLASDGWKIEAMPGDRLRIRKEGVELDPFDMTQKLLVSREITSDQWQRLVESAGIAGMSLRPQRG